MMLKHGGAFVTTRWSRVLLSADTGDSEGCAALAELCRDYWHPLYHYCRRQGLDRLDAQDATQGFFNHILESGAIGRARAERGRFRTFLLGSLRHYLANQHRHQKAGKRGGGVEPLSIDEITAGKLLTGEPADVVTPEILFERGWAYALIEKVFRRLGEEYARAGKQDLFTALRPLLTTDSARPGHMTLAARLGISTASVGTAVFRMRRRYGELMREEIAETVSSPAEVEEEIAHLIRVVAGG